ncbi:MAG: hypothetical protein JSS02_04990 [Planctomycetes bacterium]|nr:hypothetical protein [Planctomycetota bacterium]
MIQLSSGARNVIAVLIHPTGGAIDCRRRPGSHEVPPTKMLYNVSPALAIELPTLQNRLDGRQDAAFLAAGQLPAGPVE